MHAVNHMSAVDRIRQELSSVLPQSSFTRNRSIAVLLPCYNEEAAIGQVVEGFRRAMPGATIYVYDNNSSDRTAQVAAKAGAIVRHEHRQGKGNVVRRMLADVDADIYVLADGDLTYDAAASGAMVDMLVSRNLDMIVGTRITDEQEAFRRGHRFGNQLFNVIVARLFGAQFTDILSGYRVMSRRFAKSFPASSAGFETETELAVHALDLRLPTAEVPLHYGARPENSTSKLNTYRDGFRILKTIVRMFRILRPMAFYGIFSGLFLLASLVAGAPVIATYLMTGLVPRLPMAVLAAGFAQLSFMAFVCGLIIDAVSANGREQRRMRYLDLAAPGEQKPPQPASDR